MCVFLCSRPQLLILFVSPKIDGVFASFLRLHMYECVHTRRVTLHCMCNGNALKLVTPGYESVNQRTCVSAEDCRAEVLTRQQQRWGWGGGMWVDERKGESKRNERMQSGNGRMI